VYWVSLRLIDGNYRIRDARDIFHWNALIRQLQNEDRDIVAISWQCNPIKLTPRRKAIEVIALSLCWRGAHVLRDVAGQQQPHQYRHGRRDWRLTTHSLRCLVQAEKLFSPSLDCRAPHHIGG
jgi:hypothetical protein